jgi:serine/threonine protein kinase
LTTQQLAEAHAALRAAVEGQTVPDTFPTDVELSDRLVERGVLNAWQAKQLLDGRSKFTLGPYRIVDSLGQGGMGHVYKAMDVLGREVAIKVLPRDRSTPEAIANFNREIQALASLSHPKLVRALDAGYDGNVYYLVTEFVPGSDLRKLVRRLGPLSVESAASVISQVAEGLQHAHDQNMVHRDVKPGNVLVTPDGEAKLSDLGLAGPIYADSAAMRRAVEQDPRFGKIVGTADYLSPDHIKSPWNPTPAWDIYSLGCTLYYAVTGKVPFPGGTTADKARAHLELRPLDPRRLNHQLSDPFVDVLADMMAKEPAQRVASATQVIERLAPWAREAGGGIRTSMVKGIGQAPLVTAPPVTAAATASATVAPATNSSASPVPPTVPPAQDGSSSSGNFAVSPVRPATGSASVLPPPPPLRRPTAERAASPSGASPASAAIPPYMHDTVPDEPPEEPPAEHENSQESLSMVVDDPRPVPVGLLLTLVLTPVVLATLAILVGWILDVMF